MAISLKRDKDFQSVYQNGQLIKTHFFNLYFRGNNLKQNRLGIIASRKFGEAVPRNRAKRLLREAFRFLEKNCQKGFDLVLSAKADMKGKKIFEIQETLKKTLASLKILSENA